MARIVTTQYRYKRPPKKKPPVAIEVPEVVTVRDRKRVAKAGKSDSVAGSKPKANDDRKAAIVTAKTPTEISDERRRAIDAELTKDSPRFQRGKPKPAIVTSVSRKAAADDYEAATARWRAWMAKKLREDDC